MVHKVFLPVLPNYTFDIKRLREVLWTLIIDASTYMGEVKEVSYDKHWKFGYLVKGNIVSDLVWIQHASRMPTNKEFKEVLAEFVDIIESWIDYTYVYDEELFYREDEFPHRLQVIVTGEA